MYTSSSKSPWRKVLLTSYCWSSQPLDAATDRKQHTMVILVTGANVSLLEYESEVCPTLIKFKGLNVYIKLVSYSSYCQLILGWKLI